MEKQKRFYRAVGAATLATGALLLIPLIAMQVSAEVNWGLLDFAVMGALLFAAGFSFFWIIQGPTSLAHKAGIAGALGTTFLMIWANLGVGLIGSGPNAANIMFMGVPVVGLIGAFLSDFTARGLERTMYAMVGSLIVVAIIALLGNMQQYPAASTVEIVGVSGGFGFLYAVCGLIFRYAATQASSKQSKGA